MFYSLHFEFVVCENIRTKFGTTYQSFNFQANFNLLFMIKYQFVTVLVSDDFLIILK